MALDLGYHVRETTATTGTGAFTMSAAAGYLRFASQIANGATVLYTRWNSVPDIEVGVGTFDSSTHTITPLHPGTALLYSTNGGGLVSWTGTQNVAIGIPLEVFVYLFDPAASLGLVERTQAWPPVLASLPITTDGKAIIAAANYAAMRTLLTLVIGTNVQAWDADLDAIAALAKTSGNVIRANGSAWLSAVLAAADVSFASPVSPLSGATVEAVVDSAGTVLATHASQFTAAFSKSFTSTPLAVNTAAGSLLTVAHGLGAKPKLVIARLTCTSTDLAWASSDTVEIGSGVAPSENQNRGHAIYTDATNINVRFAGTPVYQIPRKDNGNTGDIAPANWTITFVAFA